MYIYPKTKLILHMHIGLGLEFFGHIGLRLKKIFNTLAYGWNIF